ncbi:MAG: hypothetical protein GEU90_06770, partial [Gemmatimonas sp.]|nr:hypothetical protein [Gemmatimonas sp.]
MFATIALLVAAAMTPPTTSGLDMLAPALVQERDEAMPAGDQHEEGGLDIMHHIQDAREIELPFGAAIHLPAEGSWVVGPIDLTPTKHVVFLWAAGALTLLLFLPAARRARRNQARSPKGG